VENCNKYVITSGGTTKIGYCRLVVVIALVMFLCPFNDAFGQCEPFTMNGVTLSSSAGCALSTYDFEEKTPMGFPVTTPGKTCTIDFPAGTDATTATVAGSTCNLIAIASFTTQTATQLVFDVPASLADNLTFNIVITNVTNASGLTTADCTVTMDKDGGGTLCESTLYDVTTTSCPTCSDAILNQTEYCVDCGGTCASCGTCTELSAGDIALIGMNATDPDEFTFVALTAIASGTTIKFTDKGWKSDDTWYATEGVLTWTAASAVSCGEEITIESGWTSTGGHTVVQTAGSFALALLGDQIIAYQGPDNSPYFLAALDNNGSPAGWDADATSAQTSDIPTGLTNGTDCISLDATDVNAAYNCGTTSGVAAILSAVNTDANWTHSGTTITLPVPCTFTCGCSEPATAPAAPTYASITTTSFDINWASGGPNYLVVVKSGSAVTANPADGTTYTANAAFGSGSDIGTGEYVVYAGTGATVSVTGLTCGTTYHVEIFSYDCTPVNYKTDAGGVSNQATSTCPAGDCFDNILNGTETGVDCGGTCPACDCE